MSAAHTPGPWTVSALSDHAIGIVAPWCERVNPATAQGFGDYRGIHVAEIQHHIGDGAAPRAHAQANAKLIAAAPDMLDALIRCELWLSTIAEGKKMQLFCRQVILAAKGESE